MDDSKKPDQELRFYEAGDRLLCLLPPSTINLAENAIRYHPKYIGRTLEIIDVDKNGNMKVIGTMKLT